tara:strand:- start:2332 stop:2613 length:282 start_codon:yes stop_codon:yes gene_type:complete
MQTIDIENIGMNKIRTLLIILLINSLSGCVMIEQYSEASKYDQNSPDAKECDYEAKKATASMPNNSRSGINFEQMYKEKELFNLCMRNKQNKK